MNYKFSYQKVRINKQHYYKLYVYINKNNKVTKYSDATKICWNFFKKLNEELSEEFILNMKQNGVILNNSNKLLNNSFLFESKVQCQKAIEIFNSYILIQKFLNCGESIND